MKKTSLSGSLTAVCVLILAFSVTGCAGRAKNGTIKGSKTAAKIKKIEANNEGLFFNSDKFHLYTFDALEIAPLDIFLSANYPDAFLDEEEAKRLKVKYFAKMKKVINGIYDMPDKDSKRVLILRTSLIDVMPDNHTLKLPPMRALKTPMDMSDTALMIEFVDAQSDEILASLFDESLGQKIQHTLVREWSDADDTFDELAEILKNYIISTQNHSDELRAAIEYDTAEFH